MITNKVYLDKNFYKKLIAIGLPIAIQNFITSALNMIDVFMISSLGDASIAGVGAANKVFFLLMLLLFGTSSGTAIFASQYWGKRDVKNIRRILGICLIIGLSGGLLFSLGAILLPQAIMRVFTTETAVISEGTRYLRIIGISYCFTSITFSYVFILRSTHEVKIPMIITIVSIGINTFLNWVLIFGNLGLPALGVQGAAIATVFARIVECLILLMIVYKKKLPAAAKISELLDINKAYVINYFNTVLPVIGNEIMWASGVTMYSIVYGRMGDVVMASITITQTIEQLGFVLFFGISSASAVILGNEIGANHVEKAYNYAKKFLKLTLKLSVAISLILLVINNNIVNIFDVSEVVRNNITLCLIVFALYLPIKVINLVIIVGILRSGGDTKFTMLLDIGAVWFIGVPLAFISGLVLKLDIQYVYALVMAEEFIKLGFGLQRFYSRKWINNLVSSKA